MRKLVIFAAATLFACDPNNNNNNESCLDGQNFCSGLDFLVCQDGEFVQTQTCPNACLDSLGCVACDPELGGACVGDELHACNFDGSIGALEETCGANECTPSGCISNCAAGAELIYLVDQTNNLFSFDPELLDAGQDPFTLIGTLSCPAGSSFPGFPNPATPFSMSVDRDAKAWVLYTSGEIFHVSTTDASCQPSGFTVAQDDFELFGMGFVSDAAGSTSETLYIAGGPVDRFTIGDLGSVNPASLDVSPIGALPNDPANSPELTGNGNGDLFGFYPGDPFTQSQVAHINKQTAQHITTFRFDAPDGDLLAWAFAHFGGDFYLFFTVADPLFGDTNSSAFFMDGETGTVTPKLTNLPNIFVGAGVSTCAPTAID